jgi:hypothetical protein
MMQELLTRAEDSNSPSVLDELWVVYNYFSVTPILACPFFIFSSLVFLYNFFASCTVKAVLRGHFCDTEKVAL